MANDAFKARAHPLRLDIVELLGAGAATVGAVACLLSKPAMPASRLVLDRGVEPLRPRWVGQG
jgi:hypothetical protein